MTRDEAKRLLGGYATGSLTESERKALFEAALDDQELFEELAGEQELAEILALPGAKQRLAAALTSAATASEGSMATNAPEEKKKRAWWLFALAGVASIGLLVWLVRPLDQTDAPVEVAAQKTAPVDLPDAKSGDSKLKEPETSPALDALARSEREKSNTTTVEEKKAAPRKSEVATTASSKSAQQGQQGRNGAVANSKQLPGLTPAPSPAPTKAPVGNGFLPGAGGAVGGFADNTGRVQLATPAAAEAQVAQGPAGVGAGKGKGGAAAVCADAPPVRAGQLTYVLTGRGSLKVTPAVSGSLEVTAGDRHVIGWDPVVAESTVEMPVPSGVDSLTLRFAIPGQQPQVVQIPIR